MVKGISKQVIVVNSPDKKMFEQAIFILSDEAMKQNGVSNDALLREAKSLLHKPAKRQKNTPMLGAGFALLGAFLTGVVWLVTAIL